MWTKNQSWPEVLADLDFKGDRVYVTYFLIAIKYHQEKLFDRNKVTNVIKTHKIFDPNDIIYLAPNFKISFIFRCPIHLYSRSQILTMH